LRQRVGLVLRNHFKPALATPSTELSPTHNVASGVVLTIDWVERGLGAAATVSVRYVPVRVAGMAWTCIPPVGGSAGSSWRANQKGHHDVVVALFSQRGRGREAAALIPTESQSTTLIGWML